MKLVYFGTPEFAVPAFNTLLNSEHEILAVVTQPDRQSGRGMKVKPSAVKREAQNAGVRVIQPQRVTDLMFTQELKRLSPSCIVVVAYGKILSPEIISMPRFGCVNVHASLLPKYRGAAPINWAIISGEGKTGVTTMLMDEGMDTGQILLQKEIEISGDDTAGSLSQKLSHLGAELLLPTLKGLENQTIQPQSQMGEISYAPIINKADGLIQWSQSAVNLCNFIRGMSPWPGAYSFLEGERIRIVKAMPTGNMLCERQDEKQKEGIIVKVTKDALYVCTAGGTISINELQPSGKPVMKVRAFLQGRRIKEGIKFGEG